jgi:hypothetical protein
MSGETHCSMNGFDRLDFICGDGHDAVLIAGFRSVDQNAGTQDETDVAMTNVVMPAVSQTYPKGLERLRTQTFEQIFQSHCCGLLDSDMSPPLFIGTLPRRLKPSMVGK